MPAATIALRIPADHPAFAGHFPGRPIVPAVVLLAEALAAIDPPRTQPLTLSSAKFLVPVGPDTPLTLSHRETEAGWRFEIHAGPELVASGAVARAAP